MTFQSNTSSWQPPDGLGYSSARPVQLAAGGIVMAVVSVVFLIAGPTLAVVINRDIQRQNQRDRVLAEQGVETSATITRVWRESDKEGTHMVAYRFVSDGREVTGSSKLYRIAWSGLHSGDPLPIRYLPSDPSVNHPAQRTPGPAPDWIPWMFAGIFIWPPFLFWAMIRRQARLLAEGRPAPATITQIRRAKQLIAYYEFPLLNGQIMKGRSQVSRRAKFEPGATACALYLPDNPKRNALYPMELVKLQK
jgi:hypothetical protein